MAAVNWLIEFITFEMYQFTLYLASTIGLKFECLFFSGRIERDTFHLILVGG